MNKMEGMRRRRREEDSSEGEGQGEGEYDGCMNMSRQVGQEEMLSFCHTKFIENQTSQLNNQYWTIAS